MASDTKSFSDYFKQLIQKHLEFEFDSIVGREAGNKTAISTFRLQSQEREDGKKHVFYDLQMEVEAAKDDQVSDFFPTRPHYYHCTALVAAQHIRLKSSFSRKILECLKRRLNLGKIFPLAQISKTRCQITLLSIFCLGRQCSGE